MRTKRIINKITVILFSFSLSTYGADLIVQDSGPIGTYPSITSAVAAANDGDRIIINNKISNLPWLENITINKSITLLSAIDNQRFLVQGDYTIQHAPGREVNIIGMENALGSILSQADGSTSYAKVHILWCKLTDGDINFNHNYFDLTVASSEILNANDVNFKFGKVVGNDLRSGRILLSGAAANSNDTIVIAGNINLKQIYLNNSTQYLLCSNNTVDQITTSSSCIAIDAAKAVTTEISAWIKNNTLKVNGSGVRGILINAAAGTNIYAYNNVISLGTGSSTYGVSKSNSGNAVVSYNHISNAITNKISGIADNGTNVTNLSFSVNIATGTNTSTATTNGGNPGLEDYDLDLTVNDAGALGGSYTLSNFHPITGGSSKVYFLQMPNQIIIGGSNSVKGNSFDR